MKLKYLFAALVSFFVYDISMAQCVVTLPNATVGKTVRVTAQLHTSDQNENGEGEPLKISSSDGSLNAQVPSYEIPYSFKFVSTSNGLTVNGSLQGSDGDESCELTASANRFSDDTKAKLNAVVVSAGLASGALWVLDAACSSAVITAPLCQVPFGLSAASSSTISGIAAALLWLDPLDPNYAQIVTAIPATYIPSATIGSLSKTQVAAFNNLMINEAVIQGQLKAMITTINRLSSAEAANDITSAARQSQSLANMNIVLATLLGKEAALRTQLAATLSSLAPITLSSNQVLNFEAQVSGGWTVRQLAFFKSFGADVETIEKARNIALVQDINAVASIANNPFAPTALITALNTASINVGLPMEIEHTDGRKDLLSVKLKSTTKFNVSTIDVQTVKFGPNGVTSAAAPSYSNSNTIPNLKDLTFYFNRKTAGIKGHHASIILTVNDLTGDIITASVSKKTREDDDE